MAIPDCRGHVKGQVSFDLEIQYQKRDWPDIAIKDVQIQISNNGHDTEQPNLRQPQLKVGAEMTISALVKLGRINPDDVSVELYHGPVDAWGEIREGVRYRNGSTNPRDRTANIGLTAHCPVPKQATAASPSGLCPKIRTWSTRMKWVWYFGNPRRRKQLRRQLSNF